MTHPFTPTYIAMAKAAEEIQAMRTHSPSDRPTFSNYELGDWFIEQRVGQVVCLGDSYAYDDGGICQSEYSGEEEYPQAWLPRLDQLMRLWADSQVPAGLAGWYTVKNAHEPGFIDLYNPKAIEEWKAYIGQFKDWHEGMLALWMREKYGKVWTGSEWAKV